MITGEGITRMNERDAVLITGSSTGIGRATALHLAKKDYLVFAGLRRSTSIEELEREERRIIPLKLDVCQEEEIRSAFAKVKDVLHRRGCRSFNLILNAGVGLGLPAEIQRSEVLREVMEVNFYGSVQVVQGFFPLLRTYGGTIIFITSINGKLALPMMSAYASSKFATEAYADALRRELALFAPGIRVVIVEPGAIRTPIFDRSSRWSQDLFASSSSPVKEVYAQTARMMERAVELSLRQASPPEKVARTIEKILRSRFPAPRYRVGLDADLQFLLVQFFPDRVVDFLIGLGFKALAWFVEKEKEPSRDSEGKDQGVKDRTREVS